MRLSSWMTHVHERAIHGATERHRIDLRQLTWWAIRGGLAPDEAEQLAVTIIRGWPR